MCILFYPALLRKVASRSLQPGPSKKKLDTFERSRDRWQRNQLVLWSFSQTRFSSVGKFSVQNVAWAASQINQKPGQPANMLRWAPPCYGEKMDPKEIIEIAVLLADLILIIQHLSEKHRSKGSESEENQNEKSSWRPKSFQLPYPEAAGAFIRPQTAAKIYTNDIQQHSRKTLVHFAYCLPKGVGLYSYLSPLGFLQRYFLCLMICGTLFGSSTHNSKTLSQSQILYASPNCYSNHARSWEKS